MPTPAIVLLSGGMDSAVALFWALSQPYHPLDAMFIDYGQRAVDAEAEASQNVWNALMQPERRNEINGILWTLRAKGMFVTDSSSILRGSVLSIDQYETVEEAVDKTHTDKSYLPLRNFVLIGLAAHKLLTSWPLGGHVVIGTRGRAGPGGFPDCTASFADEMTKAISQASERPVVIVDPLNRVDGGLTRATTIKLAQSLPGCFEALKHTVSCFKGEVPGCGHCLPCLRRAQAFEEAGVKDPALQQA